MAYMRTGRPRGRRPILAGVPCLADPADVAGYGICKNRQDLIDAASTHGMQAQGLGATAIANMRRSQAKNLGPAMAGRHRGEPLLRKPKMCTARATRYCAGFDICCVDHRQRPTGVGG